MQNRPEPARFPDPRADYIHPPNDHEGKVVETRLEKIRNGQVSRPEPENSPIIPARQKTVLEKTGVYQRPSKT